MYVSVYIYIYISIYMYVNLMFNTHLPRLSGMSGKVEGYAASLDLISGSGYATFTTVYSR